MIAAVVLATAGAAALAMPFLPLGSTWSWVINSKSDLDGAGVNANLLSVDARGALLTQQPGRAISLITAPLSLPSDAERTLVVEVACPKLALDMRSSNSVLLLWQTEAKESYSYKESYFALTGAPTRLVFNLPEEPQKIHRLGVQFPDVDGPVLIRSFEIPSLSITDRLAVFARQAGEREPLRGHSINFLRGPSMLGHGVNYYLVALAAMAVGTYVAIRLGRWRRVDPRVLVGIALATWIIADGQATANLDRNIVLGVKDFAGKPREQQIALSEGDDIAWAYQAIVEACPEGATYAVLSDDPFTPGHRLAYLLAPLRTRIEDYASADFALVIGASGASYDENQGTLQYAGGPETPAVLSAKNSDQLYLLRREAR
ncbi:MAG: hypothetical protein AMXMBFR20_05410 [Planctomycetia bacterium]